MDFRLNDEQRMWNDTVQDFMARKGLQDYRLQHDLSREFSDDVSQKMADLGWLGMLVNKSRIMLGCLGLSPSVWCRVACL
jgi:alkylation response protein AidB-like acyl-CoA dehydrogenase